MIKSPLPKLIEQPKAQPSKSERSEALSNLKPSKSTYSKASTSHLKHTNERAKAAKEFNAELEAAHGKVSPVNVSPEQELELPSSLVQPSSTIETSSPKIFDPSITKSVEKLIRPETTEVSPAPNLELSEAQIMELAQTSESDIANALLKMNQGLDQPGATSFEKNEIDAQLLSHEDFVAQKNLASKRLVTNNAYGMKALPSDQKIAAELELKQSQVVKDVAASEAPMNSQQFILGLQAEKSLPSTTETQSTQKVFDMTQIKSSNTNEVMNQITDYVVQARAAKEPTVNLRVNHEELGMIDITVSKAQHDAIAINIGTHSLDAKNFFQENSKELFNHLAGAGLNVSDLKVETPAQTAKNDFNFGSEGGRNQQGSEKQFGSEQNQRRQESERRQELWKFLNKEAA
jgi:hypothetical protein